MTKIIRLGLCAALLTITLTSSATGDNEDVLSTAFQEKIQALGLDDIVNDYSDIKKISIDQPQCAYINITGVDIMPVSKSIKQHVWVEAYLGNGNYFRKHALIAAQGNSSMGFVKKNFSADFCEDEWIGDETTSLTIGNWIKQDSYHFKAYYTDWLRGVGVVGYWLYDQMIEDVGYPWTRAVEHISKPKKNARCFPDGFPCIVYLNGNFYGIFSWQLKKHRDNMNQNKSTAGHIHLDGTMDDNILWNSNHIQWDQFEVRNPKSLYTMNGEKYDGDAPQELIDETSEYYMLETDDETVRADKQRTAQVKLYITALSRICRQLKAMEQNGKTDTDIRQEFEKHFDIQCLIDYSCHQYVTNNWDGFSKNWQWFSYDGEKWFVTPYDLDCTFGNHPTGGFTIPADIRWNGAPATTLPSAPGPMYFIQKYYMNDIKERYISLREANVFSNNNICGLLDDWYYRVGEDNYSSEWLQWPNSKCINDVIVADGWEYLGNILDQHLLPEYSSEITYSPGDRCRLNGCVWETTATTCGVNPCIRMGYVDNLDRFKQWTIDRLAILDDYFGYESISTDLSVAKNRHDAENIAIYDLQGRLCKHPNRRGIYIYKTTCGQKKIVR